MSCFDRLTVKHAEDFQSAITVHVIDFGNLGSNEFNETSNFEYEYATCIVNSTRGFEKPVSFGLK